MGVRELLMPNVVLPKVHQNDCSYVSSADVPLDSLHKNLAWWAVTRRTLKNHKLSKLGGERLPGYGRLLRTIQYSVPWFSFMCDYSCFQT